MQSGGVPSVHRDDVASDRHTSTELGESAQYCVRNNPRDGPGQSSGHDSDPATSSRPLRDVANTVTSASTSSASINDLRVGIAAVPVSEPLALFMTDNDTYVPVGSGTHTHTHTSCSHQAHASTLTHRLVDTHAGDSTVQA